VVELSTLDENKLNQIISFKRSARKSALSNAILSDNPAPVNRAATFIPTGSNTPPLAAHAWTV